jgi:hypothetical protein
MSGRNWQNSARSLTLVVRGPGGPPTAAEIAALLASMPATTGGSGEGGGARLRVYNVDYPETTAVVLCRDCAPAAATLDQPRLASANS